MAIHPGVCQKSEFHGKSDFQNSQKLDPLQIPFQAINASLSIIFWCKKLALQK